MSEQPSSESKMTPSPVASAIPDKRDKDLWDKIDILSKPFFAAVLALIGYFGQSTLTNISTQEQNARLYTELLSRREEAESALRKDMFTQIMSDFFANVDESNINNSLSKKILKLEMLALNFGDSLSLGPLFKEISSDIERVLEANTDNIDDWQNVASKYQKRLRSLAKQVAGSQLTTLYPRGENISLSEITTGDIAIPDDGKRNMEWPITVNDISQMLSDDEINAHIIEHEGVRRIFQMQFRNADYMNQSVQVKLNIFEFVTKTFTDEQNNEITYEDMDKVADMEFTLDFFNFPIINNTRLSHNQRFALVLEDFDINTIKVTGIVFPGLYASQRDKPFLNEAIQELKSQRDLSDVIKLNKPNSEI